MNLLRLIAAALWAASAAAAAQNLAVVPGDLPAAAAPAPAPGAPGDGTAEAGENGPPRIEAAVPLLEGAWRTDTEKRALRLRLPPPRGMITDRHGNPLAQMKVVFQAAINFPLLRDASDADILAYARRHFARAGRVARTAWDLPDETILNHYRNRRWLPLPFTPVLSDEQAAKLRELDKNEVFLHASYQRFYPQGSVAAHLVGYVGRIGWFPTGPAENGDPAWENVEGRFGLELTMDKHLVGREGQMSVMFDNDGSLMFEELDRKPVAGHTVVTTIDLNMQKRAEGVLSRGAKRGAFVVLDANTGEVLAMASWPTFDPNAFIPGISTEDYARLKEDKAKPMLCRAFQSRYPPASTYKIPVALAALESGTITPDTTLPGPPSLAVGNRVFNNWNKNHEGNINAATAITRSCNTWFYQVALKMGGDPLIDMAARLGFGHATGLPLQGETAGFVPDHAWAKRSMGTERLIGGSLANIAIGQGAVLSSPLQVARAMAAVGNGGTLPGVSLVKQIQDVRHNVVERIRPPAMPTGISQTSLETLVKGMDDVVNSGSGTARSARIKAAHLAGKTGTGQWKPTISQNVAWFAGFVPAEKPRYAFAILYEGNPGEKVSGGRSAAPMAAEFFGPLIEAEVKAEKQLVASEKNKAIEEALRSAEEGARERAAAESAAGRGGDRETQQAVDEVLRGIRVPVAPARPVQEPPPAPPEKKPGFFKRLFGG
jgi:penicillin-binding protein 2